MRGGGWRVGDREGCLHAVEYLFHRPSGSKCRVISKSGVNDIEGE